MSLKQLLIDVHTHCYLPRYAAFLRQRAHVPKIFTRGNEERLLILDDEPSAGRPVGPQYWDRDEKLKFMDVHGIDVSIVSTANPWLDFLSPSAAHTLATELNNDLEEYCATSPLVPASEGIQRLYGFGLLPLVPDVSVDAILQIIGQISSLSHLKGVIMGTRGVGRGLDDPALEPVWEALATTKLVVFLHPHYGLGQGAKEAWGECDNGHVLPLAMGFPMETTIHDVRYYVSKLYYDAVNYGPEEMGFVADVIGRGGAYAHSQSQQTREDRTSGYHRMLFGTDHPFFPPLAGERKWKSVVENLQAIQDVRGWGDSHKVAVRGGNAIEIFGLRQ
ncbi:hypothetical protein FRC17_009414 [Serendipita sp. 399]|nr:hypothetical protein FRC17_009414 [Serendipita sp. 399]